MYSTVIDRHPTGITHPIAQPFSSSVPTSATAHLAAGFNQSPPNEIENLIPGAYSIPVKIQGGALNDPTLSGYESPNFISKKEKILPGLDIATPLPDAGINISSASSSDLKEVTAKLSACENKQQKLQICK
jgi:hypothetical protein